MLSEPVWVFLIYVAFVPLVFFSRTIYKIYWSDFISADGYYHLKYISELRRGGHRLPNEPSGIVTDGTHAYPFFVHWLLSYLPEQYDVKVDKYFSGTLDVLFSSLFAVLYFAGLFSVVEVAIALLVFLLTPEFMRFDIAHGKCVSSRKPGLLLTTVTFLSFVLWSLTGETLLLLLTPLIGATIFLSSKFSIQAYFFIYLSLLAGGFYLVAPVVLLSLLLAVLVTSGSYIRVLSAQIRHLTYFSEIQYEVLDQRRSITEWLHELSDVRSMKDLGYTLYNTYDIRAIAYNPYSIGVAAVYVTFFITDHSLSVVPAPIHYWIWGGFAAYILTSYRHLRFIGAPERYLEYVFLPSTILLIDTSRAYGGVFTHILFGTCLAGLGVAIFSYWYHLVKSDYSRNQDREDIITHLQQLDTRTVLVQPLSHAEEFIYRTDHEFVHFLTNLHSTRDASEEFKTTTAGNHSKHVTDDVQYLSERYDPDIVVFDTKADYGGLQPPDDDPEARFGRYAMFRFEQLSSDV